MRSTSRRNDPERSRSSARRFATMFHRRTTLFLERAHPAIQKSHTEVSTSAAGGCPSIHAGRPSWLRICCRDWRQPASIMGHRDATRSRGNRHEAFAPPACHRIGIGSLARPCGRRGGKYGRGTPLQHVQRHRGERNPVLLSSEVRVDNPNVRDSHPFREDGRRARYSPGALILHLETVVRLSTASPRDSSAFRFRVKPLIPISRALAGTVAVAILAGMVPAGIVLDRRLVASLEAKARTDLELAPRLLADRNSAHADAMMMYAKEFAHAPGLVEAMAASNAGGADEGLLRVIERSRATLGHGLPIIVGRDGRTLLGPLPVQSMIDRTRKGDMPVEMFTDGLVVRNVALAPVVKDGQWVGAAGLASPLDVEQAFALAGLTRSSVVIVSSESDSITATTMDSTVARALNDRLATVGTTSTAQDVLLNGERYIAVSAMLDDAGHVLFVRSMRDELALLPNLRRTAAISAAAAVAFAMLLGTWLATRVSAPVAQLARAARAIREGEFDAPLPRSHLSEVASVAAQFDDMRRALAARLAELRETALQLKDRNARLTALQSDLMQRERLAASGRLVAQLAHEIRNPVANLRNCLEVVHRRVGHDDEAREFVELAIDELLRMHELAEQMLDLNRPRDHAQRDCRPTRVASEVARLATAGIPRGDLEVRVEGDEEQRAAIAPDALKQVLLNLVQNAREAADAGGNGRQATRDSGVIVAISVSRAGEQLRLEVSDNGPGVPPDRRERIFDPFYSTKSAVQGVGLGLFVAEGLIRGAGGRLSVTESAMGGAAFVLDLPLVDEGAEVAGPAPAAHSSLVSSAPLAEWG